MVLSDLLAKASTEEPVSKEKIDTKDTILYVYTSGTTGMF